MISDKGRMASVPVFIALIGIAAIGGIAAAEKDQNLAVPLDGSAQMVKIGAIYNLEGSQSPLDLPSARGARLAANEINARGGIDGREIILIMCDGKSDPSRVRECAKELLDENVSAMMGLSDTDMILAAIPVAAEAGLPFVTSGATSPELVNDYDGLFLACFGDNVQAAAGAEYAYERGLKRCALLVDGEMEFARILSRYFKERYLDLGGKIVMEADVNGTGLMNLSQAVANRSPDMIYLAANPEEASAIIEAMRRAGIQSPVFGGDSLDSAKLRRAGMGRIVFSTHALIDESSKSISTGEFARAYRAEYGYPPENAFSALGYDAVNLLADAIERAGSSEPQAILKALENTSGFKGVTGEISYENGSRIPEKGVTMVSLLDGKVVGSEVVKPAQIV
jgi:branched-chain amino acid transport system substrate-binding protein